MTQSSYRINSYSINKHKDNQTISRLLNFIQENNQRVWHTKKNICNLGHQNQKYNESIQLKDYILPKRNQNLRGHVEVDSIEYAESYYSKLHYTKREGCASLLPSIQTRKFDLRFSQNIDKNQNYNSKKEEIKLWNSSHSQKTGTLSLKFLHCDNTGTKKKEGIEKLKKNQNKINKFQKLVSLPYQMVEKQTNGFECSRWSFKNEFDDQQILKI